MRPNSAKKCAQIRGLFGRRREFCSATQELQSGKFGLRVEKRACARSAYFVPLLTYSIPVEIQAIQEQRIISKQASACLQTTRTDWRLACVADFLSPRYALYYLVVFGVAIGYWIAKR
jgi:hypothetical protein